MTLHLCVCVASYVLALPPQFPSHFTVIVSCFRSFQVYIRLKKQLQWYSNTGHQKLLCKSLPIHTQDKKKKPIMEYATLLIFFTHYLHYCYLESVYFSDITFVHVCDITFYVLALLSFLLILQLLSHASGLFKNL